MTAVTRPVAALAVLAALQAPAAAQPGAPDQPSDGFVVTGMARVIDGDRLAIDGRMIWLYGIDAPEDGQPCNIDGERWACGPVAYRALEILVADQPTTCHQRRDPTIRRRTITFAVCESGGVDLSEEMVRSGMAVAVRDQTTDYVEAEEEAKAARRGIWQSEFQMPWEWRFDQFTR